MTPTLQSSAVATAPTSPLAAALAAAAALGPVRRSLWCGVPGCFQVRVLIGRSSWTVRALGRTCPAHGPPSDLADPVLDPATPVRPLVHGALMSLNQEGRCGGGDGESLPLSYPCKVLIVLAGPVDVDAARGTVPLLVRSLFAALGALHGPCPGIAREAPA